MKKMSMCKRKGTAIQRNAKSDENEDLFERVEVGLVDWQMPSQRKGKNGGDTNCFCLLFCLFVGRLTALLQ